MNFAEVIIPLSIEGTFTYEIPLDLQGKINIGQRVVVPFGGKKLYTGIISEIHNKKPELYKTKEIYTVLENIPMVNENQIEFWKWISEYYLCPLGEVYKNAFPSALKLESETFIRRTEKDIKEKELNEKETLVLQSLENKSSINLKEIETFLPKKYIISTIKSLYEENFIELDEQIIEKYKPKQITYLKLNPEFENTEKLKTALIQVEKAPKQRETFLLFIQKQQRRTTFIEKKELVEETSPAAVKGLLEKNFLQEFSLQKDRLEEYDDHIEDAYELTPSQQEAVNQIEKLFVQFSTVLFQGVTASGKTEIYFHLIEKLPIEKTVLLLLPEIAITTQLVNKIKKRFGEDVGVYHSKMNQNERVEVWKNTLKGKYRIIIGARSAMFLPLKNIGLIIIDEEHETSYKQSERPYYHTRDCVHILAQQNNAKILLGSATPSLESIYNCRQGKFGFVELKERYSGMQFPETVMIDLKKTGATTNISYELKSEIEKCLENKKQVILFHNRRGFSPILECNTCGHSPGCPNCDVSLTYHKTTTTLRCHYCGYTRALPESCPSCHSHNMESKGIGTQQIEEEIKHLFPDSRVARMDVDTMKRKHAYEILFEKMELKEIDILIGTQMVTKGLDFDSVQLVGVIRADSLMNLPYFRAEEKAVQLLIQVSGRAGRREEKGKVLFQTFDPANPLYLFVKENNYDLVVEAILKEREEFLYPPYYRLIEITIKHKKQEKAKKTADFIRDYLYHYIQEPMILGPEEAIIARINNQYIYKILLKHPANKSIKNLKRYLSESIKQTRIISSFKSVIISIDVDPI